jgi:tetratricopeptide (TPR) repeat protein
MSLAGLGRIDEAISEYEAALALNPSHPQSLLGLGRVLLFGKNDVQRGIEAWSRLLEASPESPEAESIREELEALKAAHSNS